MQEGGVHDDEDPSLHDVPGSQPNSIYTRAKSNRRQWMKKFVHSELFHIFDNVCVLATKHTTNLQYPTINWSNVNKRFPEFSASRYIRIILLILLKFHIISEKLLIFCVKIMMKYFSRFVVTSVTDPTPVKLGLLDA